MKTTVIWVMPFVLIDRVYFYLKRYNITFISVQIKSVYVEEQRFFFQNRQFPVNHPVL